MFFGQDPHFRLLVLPVRVFGLVEEVEDLVVLALLERIVLVIVALHAAHRRAHPDFKGGIDPVHHGRDAELFVVRAAFCVCHRIAMKGRGQDLIRCRLGQQVAGYLFARKLVERHVGVISADGPVAVRPYRTAQVFLISHGVGVARQVHPLAGPLFAVMWRCEQALDERIVVPVGRALGQGVSVFQCRRQPG